MTVRDDKLTVYIMLKFIDVIYSLLYLPWLVKHSVVYKMKRRIVVAANGR